jgi:hypothetical protein
MAALLRDVLALPSAPVEGSGHDFFSLPDRSTFAIAGRQSTGRGWEAAFGTTIFSQDLR